MTDRATGAHEFPCLIAGTARPRGAPDRVRHPRRRAAARPFARRSARRRRRASRAGVAARARPRPHPPAGRDGAAPPRHAASSARPLSRPRHPEGLAAGRDRAAARRGADSLARRARPRGGRPVGAAGPAGPARCGLCRAGQRRAAPYCKKCRSAIARQGHRHARHPGLADGALAARLRARARARHRGGQRPGAGARYHGEVRS